MRHLEPIWRSPFFWIIVGLFGIVLILEFSTPPEYVMGYLYVSPILLANSRWSRVAIFQIVLIAVILTLLNIWIPANEEIHASMIVNRLVTVFALILTGFLSDQSQINMIMMNFHSDKSSLLVRPYALNY